MEFQAIFTHSVRKATTADQIQIELFALVELAQLYLGRYYPNNSNKFVVLFFCEEAKSRWFPGVKLMLQFFSWKH